MSELIKQGLEISVLGMGLTFAALGLLIVAMLLLERLFREGEEEALVVDTAVSPLTTPATENDAEIAAAIAAALAHWQAQPQSSLGETLHQPRSRWWTHGSEQ
ncbi:MAG: OadG family transporter subunit [Anaerolineae bacterium]